MCRCPIPTSSEGLATVHRGAGTAIGRRAVLTMGAAAAASAGGGLSSAQPTAVTLGQVSLTFYAVVGAVVHETLARLGHTVVVREDAHERMFPLLGAGAVDLMAAAWLPGGHADYWRQYGGQAMEVATLYEGAR